MSKATEADNVKLQRVIGYLAGTPDLGKRLGGNPNGNATHTSFSEASFAVHGDMKSHNGQFITLGLGGILIKSNKEKLVTRSSTEAELLRLKRLLSKPMYYRRVEASLTQWIRFLRS